MYPSPSNAQEGAATGKNGDQGDKGDIIKEVKETHIVVATLIATVSFAAGFTMPGGYQGEKGPDQGFAVLTKTVAFQAFVITNTSAMTLSSCSVMMHLYWSAYGINRKSLPKAFTYVYMCTMLALIAMVIAFITGTYAVLDHSSGLAIVVCVLTSVLFFVLTECLTYVDKEEIPGPRLLLLSILFWLVCEMMRILFQICKDCLTCTKSKSGQNKEFR